MVLGIKNRNLNDDILNQIWSFISFEKSPNLLMLNKNYYTNYRQYTKISNENTYTRFLIRNDYNFLFSFLLLNNICKNINLRKKYKYKKETFKNYIHFLNSLCINYNSIKCKTLVRNYL
jgi:hypothetical protein